MFIKNGVITALVTPFSDNGDVDFKSFESLLDHQWNNGIRQFVVNGTTAESPNLTRKEVEDLIHCVRAYNKEAKIILGTGSNSTTKTIEMTNWGKKQGIDAALVVVPYYNKPSQKGIEAHFFAVAEQVDTPIIMYNVPGRTIVSMGASAAISLSKVGNIIGTKEASGDMKLMETIKSGVDENWQIFSGDDDSCLELCMLGGHGVISVISHLIPKEMIKIVNQAMENDDECLKELIKYKNLLKYLSIEPNPVPVKWALQKMGIIKTSKVRLPLVGMSNDNNNYMSEVLNNLGLI